MKIDPKSLIIGSLIALLLYPAIAYGVGFIYRFEFYITVPPMSRIRINNLPPDDTYSIDIGPVSKTAQYAFNIRNEGSGTAEARWRVEDLPNGFTAEMKYDERLPGQGTVTRDWTGSLTIDAGGSYLAYIIITNVNAPPGDYDFTLIIEEA